MKTSAVWLQEIMGRIIGGAFFYEETGKS